MQPESSVAVKVYVVVTVGNTNGLGEVGLSGEVRGVSNLAGRLSEAEKLGFKKAIVPKSNLKSFNYKGKLKIIGVENLKEAIDFIRNTD